MIQKPPPDVLIVGAGPTGLMLACQLVIHQIPFRLIDKNDDHTTQSRALVIQARSVEILDQMGISQKAIQHGKIARAIGVFINGKKIIRVPVFDIGKGLTKFPHMLMLEQSHTERILVEFLKDHGCEVERNTELIHITQLQEEVICVLQSQSGVEERVKVKYVVGADGAHSIVREQLKIPFSGKTYQQSLFVLDCKADVDLPNDEMYLTFAGISFGGFFPLTNDRWRILGNIPSELSAHEEITFESVEKNFAQRVRMRVKLYDPRWLSVYHSHHRYASSFRSGRCFLAGDAAHIHSPVGAQGMNTGLQDAYNLAWKLTMVLNGLSNESLLDTYTEERITIARKLVRTTDRVFNVLTSAKTSVKIIRLYILPVVLKIAGPVFQKLKFIQRFAFRTVSEIAIHYRTSSLSLNASLGKFSSRAPRPGDRLPFVVYEDASGTKTNTQDIIRNKFFCVIIFGNDIPEEVITALVPLHNFVSYQLISYSEKSKDVYTIFGINNTGLYLIRPDMYIAYRSKGFDAGHLQTYLSQFIHENTV